MPEHGEFDVFESHVRSKPVRPVLGLAPVTLRGAGRLECRFGSEMRLADKCGLVTAARKRACETLRADLGIEIDTVVPHAVRQWQQAGEDGRARRLAHEVRRDASGETRTVAREPVEMRRFDFGALESITIAALLIGSDQQNVGLF